MKMTPAGALRLERRKLRRKKDAERRWNARLRKEAAPQPRRRCCNRVLAVCWLALLVLLIVLSCWSAGLLSRVWAPEVEFSDVSEQFVLRICELRPPLSASSKVNERLELGKIFEYFMCIANNIFQARFGLPGEKPHAADCEANISAEDILQLQSIYSHFEPLEICRKYLGSTGLLCRQAVYETDLVCEECSRIGSGVRLNLLNEKYLELHKRGWLSPYVTWQEDTLVVPFDTAFLAYVLNYMNLTGMMTAMQTAFVAAENVAMQDLTRPWHTIEEHAFSFVADDVPQQVPLVHKMTEFQFYWMLRIENYCAVRYSPGQRKSADRTYMLLLNDVIRLLFNSTS